MKVLFVASECVPLVKTGGLADVVGALPLALAPLGCEVTVLLPAYRGVLPSLEDRSVVAEFADLFGGDGRLVAGRIGRLTVLAIDAPHLYDRDGGPYVAPDGRDWPDNHRRFAALGWVAAQVALGRTSLPIPDVVHVHDWQAALTIAHLHVAREAGVAAPRTVLTIHNLAFQGVFGHDVTPELRLPERTFAHDGMEFWGNISYLKAGVHWADRITTVSPTYAREILTPEWGMGFDGLLRSRSDRLTGIVNGIDLDVWNPATDTHLSSNYSAARVASKASNKAALQIELGLDVRVDSPLFCVVSRLTTQKGLDLLLDALPHLVSRRAQLAVLGTGDAALEDGFRSAAIEHPGSVATVIGFDEPLSHRMQAGADAIVVPSRFEPCGLTQLYGLRYGTIPVVARVGGLADTVIDANRAALHDGVATGIQFSPVDTTHLTMALDRTCDLFADRTNWQRLQSRAMTRTVGWDVAAGSYLDLYRRLVDSSVTADAPSDRRPRIG